MCFEILRSDIPVIAACPVVPACNQLWYWNYADAGRKKFCSEKWDSQALILHGPAARNLLMLSCSPFWSGIENLPSKGELFSVGRVKFWRKYE